MREKSLQKTAKTISLPVELIEVLKQEAISKGVSVATVMTWLIEAFLESAEKEQIQFPLQRNAYYARRLLTKIEKLRIHAKGKTLSLHDHHPQDVNMTLF